MDSMNVKFIQPKKLLYNECKPYSKSSKKKKTGELLLTSKNYYSVKFTTAKKCYNS